MTSPSPSPSPTTPPFPSTTLSISGTPTIFLPLPTAWPSGSDCSQNLYLHTPVNDPYTFLAYDPLYGASMVTSAQSCLPPQVTAWWRQASNSGRGDLATALGPTFVCPQAYSAVQTVLVESGVEQVFCCPSKYSLLVPQPNTAGAFPSQCISTVRSGQVITFLSSQAMPGQFTATSSINATATVFGIPVNGFNFVAEATSSSSSSISSRVDISSSVTAVLGSPTQPSSSAAGSVSESSHLGKYLGISLGTLAGALIIAAVAFLSWRRMKVRGRVVKDEGVPELQGHGRFELAVEKPRQRVEERVFELGGS